MNDKTKLLFKKSSQTCNFQNMHICTGFKSAKNLSWRTCPLCRNARLIEGKIGRSTYVYPNEYNKIAPTTKYAIWNFI